MISKAVAEGLRRRGVDATAAQALLETTGLDDEEHRLLLLSRGGLTVETYPHF